MSASDAKIRIVTPTDSLVDNGGDSDYKAEV